MIKAAYIHIPFCNDICTYCDFCKFYYNPKWVKAYLNALEKEIKTRYHGEILKTIYIGGGTPSALSLVELEKLLKITKIFKTNQLEFTFECNIESIDEDKAKLLYKYGVNRISIGVQTFNDKFLAYLNRKHNKEMVFAKIKMLKKYFTNINIDLIYALPLETLEDLEKDIDTFLELDVSHISTYSLIVEKHTMLGNKKVMNIDEELDAKMYEMIVHKLANYEHYELSNFGKKKCMHNLTYWNNEEYYGFGLGASGYEGDIRYTNTRSLTNYLNSQYRYVEEKISFNEKLENAFILGFRQIKGINKDTFYQKYHINIRDIDVVNHLIKNNYLMDDGYNIFINPKYLYVSNDILVEFMGENYERYV